MKVLITGANGFLGPAVADRLLESGVTDLRCFVRPGGNYERLDALRERFPGARIELAMGDLTSPDDAQKAVEGIDTVYHLAAALKGSPADMFLNTVASSKHLLEAMTKNRPPRVVLVSSFGVYGTSDLPAGFVVNEATAHEPHPERRDVYSHTKWRQERLFWEYRDKHGFPLVVVRPGVIYGPRGPALSARIGIRMFGLFLHMGRSNVLPLTYVDNCADAIVLAGQQAADGETYNIVDDDLPTSAYYLRSYRREVEGFKYVTVPYAVIRGLSLMVEKYHSASKGQLPDVLTRYKTASLWKGNSFDNSRIKMLGWKQRVSTDEGMKRTFAFFRSLNGSKG